MTLPEAYAIAVCVAAVAIGACVLLAINLREANDHIDLLLATESELTRQRNNAAEAAAALAKQLVDQPLFPFPDPAFLAGPADLPAETVAAFIADVEAHANQAGGA